MGRSLDRATALCGALAGTLGAGLRVGCLSGRGDFPVQFWPDAAGAGRRGRFVHCTIRPLV